jgi:GNAT superfamily N-acetyltransferase
MSDSGTQDKNFSIRPAQKEDQRVVKGLLPEPFKSAMRARFFVAAPIDGPRIIGAAASSPYDQMGGPKAARTALRVIKPWRRQGVGSALVEHVKSAVRERGREAVFAWRPVEPGAEEYLKWERLGFSKYDTIEHHQVELAHVRQFIGPLYRQLRQRKHIPEDARIVPLDEADLEQVARLQVGQLGGNIRRLKKRLMGEGPSPCHPKLSRCLLKGDRVVGIALVRQEGPKTAAVDALVVSPEVRGGWVNTWLRFDGAQNGLDLGVEKIRFRTFSAHSDTRKMARKMGATLVKKNIRMYLPLEL